MYADARIESIVYNPMIQGRHFDISHNNEIWIRTPTEALTKVLLTNKQQTYHGARSYHGSPRGYVSALNVQTSRILMRRLRSRSIIRSILGRYRLEASGHSRLLGCSI